MCINKETSMGAFLLGFILSSYILYRGLKINNKKDFVVGSLFITISCMQLLEYFIWKNQECNSDNSFYTILIIVLLLIQILVYYLTTNYAFNIKDITIHVAIFTAVIIFTYLVIKLIKNKDKLCSKPRLNSCRLEWDSFKYLFNNHFILFMIAAFLYLYMMYKLKHYIDNDKTPFLSKNMNTLALILAIIVGIIINKKHFFNIFGSLWCFISAFFPIIYLLKI